MTTPRLSSAHITASPYSLGKSFDDVTVNLELHDGTYDGTLSSLKDRARRLIRELMDEHGLHDWTFVIKQQAQRKVLGHCKGSEKRLMFIRAFELYESNWDALVETVHHEIAHALCYEAYDKNSFGTNRTGHSTTWKMVAWHISGQTLKSSCAQPMRLEQPRHKNTLAITLGELGQKIEGYGEVRYGDLLAFVMRGSVTPVVITSARGDVLIASVDEGTTVEVPRSYVEAFPGRILDIEQRKSSIYDPYAR